MKPLKFNENHRKVHRLHQKQNPGNDYPKNKRKLKQKTKCGKSNYAS